MLRLFGMLISLSASIAHAAGDCPETLLKDFKIEVTTQAQASKLFKSYFTPEKGFPAFKPESVHTDTVTKRANFWYDNFYGQGPNGLGGYLYADGRLVKKGYCK